MAKSSGTDPGFVQNGNVPAGYAANYNYNYDVTPGLPPYGSGNFVLGWRFDGPLGNFNPLSGAIDDWAGSYRAAFAAGVLWNALNGAIILFLLLRRRTHAPILSAA